MIRISKAGKLAAALAFGIAGIAAVGPALSQAPAASAIGPAVGSRIALTTPLTDSAGRPTTLAAIGHGRPVMLVLFRSAAWCPYCQAQLKGLGPVAAAARTNGVTLAGISYDRPQVLADFTAKQHLAFPLFSDPGSRLIDTLKLRDPQYPAGSFADGVPHPTVLLIDGKGRVKAKSVETNYKIRPSQADLIAMLKLA